VWRGAGYHVPFVAALESPGISSRTGISRRHSWRRTSRPRGRRGRPTNAGESCGRCLRSSGSARAGSSASGRSQRPRRCSRSHVR